MEKHKRTAIRVVLTFLVWSARQQRKVYTSQTVGTCRSDDLYSQEPLKQ